MNLSVSERLKRDVVCDGCQGTGKRGRGKCSACLGKGEASSLDQPRVRFNWGYHDAASEARRGKPRTVVASGPQSETAVSPDFNFWYASGYAAGLADVAAGTYVDNSEGAWVRFTGPTVPFRGEPPAVAYSVTYEDPAECPAGAAKISVYEPCACETCASPRSRWFQCRRIGERLIAAYDVHGYDYTTAPHPNAVAAVEAAFPGKVLVYVK